MAVQDIWLFEGEATAEDVKLRPEGAEAGGYSISGTVYINEGVTDIGIDKTIAVCVNDVKQAETAETNVNGEYTIEGLTLGINDLVTVFIDGESEKGCTVTRVTAANQIDIDIYEDHVILRYEIGSNITATDTESAGDSDIDPDIPFESPDGSVLDITVGTELYIWTGKTFIVNKDVSADNYKVIGTLEVDANANAVYILTRSGGTYTNTGVTEISNSSNTIKFGAVSGSWIFTGNDIVENDLSYTIGDVNYQQDFVVS